ncbi:MAG: aroA, partial [Gammaproteobacteria bacterium]|nr:aroA [Gammaproteobacteria bacterium]
MSNQIIQPVFHAIDAQVAVPGSKSMSNRALLLAALAKGYSRLEGVLFSEDTLAFAEALVELGLKLNINFKHNLVEIEGQAGLFSNKLNANIYCKDAGTATRFLIPVCAAAPGNYHFSASPRMSGRPIKALLKVLEQQAARFQFEAQDYRMPFNMQSFGLKGGKVSVDIEESSQFLSGLLMAAPYAQKPMVLGSSQVLDQKTYVHMTVKMMAEFGISCDWIDNKTLAVPQGTYQARQYQIEPDASTASYFFAMAAITGGKMHVPNLSKDSKQGDIRFLNVLERMGCKVYEEQGGISLIGPGQLKSVGNINMTGYTDTFMTLACVAVFADSPTTICGLAHTRLQESDRIT